MLRGDPRTRPTFPVDFGPRCARRIGDCTITMKRIRQMQRSRYAHVPAG